jgi:hypothetical protein
LDVSLLPLGRPDFDLKPVRLPIVLLNEEGSQRLDIWISNRINPIDLGQIVFNLQNIDILLALH